MIGSKNVVWIDAGLKSNLQRRLISNKSRSQFMRTARSCRPQKPKLAEVIETSLDYLAFESAKLPIRIQDQELLNKIQILDRLPEWEKELAK